MARLTHDELRSLQELTVWPSLVEIPQAHIDRFRELGLVTEVLGGRGWKPNDAGKRLLMEAHR